MTDYPSFKEAVDGGLFHPNCRHSTSLYQEGVTVAPTDTADPAGDKARQDLRAMERHVREWKRREAAALTPEGKAKARVQVRAYQAQIRHHVATTTAKRQPQRERLAKAQAPKPLTQAERDMVEKHLAPEKVANPPAPKRSVEAALSANTRTPHKYVDDWLGAEDTRFTDFENKVLRQYTVSSGRFNMAVRTDPYSAKRLNDLPPEMQASAKAGAGALDSAFSKTPPTTGDTRVYRGVSRFGSAEEWETLSASKPEDVFREPGFSSTSANLKGAEGFAGVNARLSPVQMERLGIGPDNSRLILDIRMPKGSKALALRKGSAHGAGADEILLPRGAQFRVLRELYEEDLKPGPDTPKGAFRRILTVELVLPT